MLNYTVGYDESQPCSIKLSSTKCANCVLPYPLAANMSHSTKRGKSSTCTHSVNYQTSWMCIENANSSYDCPSEFFSNIVPLIRNLQLSFLFILTTAAVSLNLLVLAVAWKTRKSADCESEMATNVVIAALDIAWILLVHPIAISAIVSKSWPHGEVFCKVTGSFTFGIILLRNQLVILTLLDRFCYVFAPFHYPRCRRKILGTLAVASVTFTVIYAILPAMVPKAGEYSFYSAYATCFLEVSCSEPACYAFVAVVMAHWAVCWAFLPTLLFTIMCIKARMMKHHPVMGTFNPVDDIPPATPTLAPTPGNERLAIVDSAARHNSCASHQTISSARNSIHISRRPSALSTKNELAPIVQTYVLHLAIYVGCILPLGVHFFTIRAGFAHGTIDQFTTTIGLLCGDTHLLLTALDPIMVLRQKYARQTLTFCYRSSQ